MIEEGLRTATLIGDEVRECRDLRRTGTASRAMARRALVTGLCWPRPLRLLRYRKSSPEESQVRRLTSHTLQSCQCSLTDIELRTQHDHFNKQTSCASREPARTAVRPSTSPTHYDLCNLHGTLTPLTPSQRKKHGGAAGSISPA